MNKDEMAAKLAQTTRYGEPAWLPGEAINLYRLEHFTRTSDGKPISLNEIRRKARAARISYLRMLSIHLQHGLGALPDRGESLFPATAEEHELVALIEIVDGTIVCQQRLLHPALNEREEEEY